MLDLLVKKYQFFSFLKKNHGFKISVFRGNCRVLNKFFCSTISETHQNPSTQTLGSQCLSALNIWAAGSVCTLVATAYSLFGGGNLAAVANPVAVTAQSGPSAAWVANAAAVTRTHNLPDGVYLYGESSEPNELGRAYLIFEVRSAQLIGAFYMPSSSFDCLYGTVEPQQLALTIVDSYENTEYSYAVGIEHSPIASSQNPARDNIVRLEGLQSISTVSENDQRILNVCKENYQEQVWQQ